MQKRNLTHHQNTTHQTRPKNQQLLREEDENEINIKDYLWNKNQELIRLIKTE